MEQMLGRCARVSELTLVVIALVHFANTLGAAFLAKKHEPLFYNVLT